jgi:hypothetical protein
MATAQTLKGMSHVELKLSCVIKILPQVTGNKILTGLIISFAVGHIWPVNSQLLTSYF